MSDPEQASDTDAIYAPILDDLRERFIKARYELSNAAENVDDVCERYRIHGKADGVSLALSYLDEAVRQAHAAGGRGNEMSDPVQAPEVDPVVRWFWDKGAAIAKEVDRLWPDEGDPAYRAACLAEEAGEVNRAVTKRRHASFASDGTCKGNTYDEWTRELWIELSQALGVILDIAHREQLDLVGGTDECLVILQHRKAGS